MSNEKISQLTDGAKIQITDKIPVLRAGGNVKVDVGSLAPLFTVSTTQIDNDAVTLEKIQNAASNDILLGSGNTGLGNDYSEVTLGTNLTMSGTTLNASGGGSTNLGYAASAADGTVTSDTGTDATLPLVVAAGDAGLMTGADKTKLNGIDAGATVNSSDAFLLARANHTGTQTLSTISDSGTIAKTDIEQTYSKQQNFAATALVDGANIAWNLADNQVASVTLTGNRTLDNPTNLVAGGTYILTVKQDVTGTRTLAYGTNYKFPEGVAPILSTGTNAIDILTFISDGTSMFGVIQQDFA